MSKKFFYCFFILGFFFLLALPVLAQRQLEDYFFQYEQYRKIYEQFKINRDKFLKYGALSVKEETVKATKDFLLQRNQVLRTYFLALKYKLRNTSGVIQSQQNGGLISRLDKEISWLEDQSDEIKSFSNPSLEDLFVFSDRVEDKKENFSVLAYESLGEVILGKIRTFQQKSVVNTSLVKDKVTASKNATISAQLNLWLKEVEVKNYLAQKEIESAETNLWNIKGARRGKQAKNFFDNLRIDAEDSKLYLEQACSFQKEILSQLSND